MRVTKVTRKVYEITPYSDVWDITMKEFRKQRREVGMGVQKFEKCFCCGYTFKDEEVPVLANVSSKGNRFICLTCLKEGDGKEYVDE